MQTTKKTGKEATKSNKVIYDDNQSTLKFYFYVITASFSFYLLVTLAFFYAQFTRRYILLTMFSGSVTLVSYKFMAWMSSPKFKVDERGKEQIVDAGLDLNFTNGGIAEHAKDAILACCITQALAALHNGFWLLLLFIPFRAFHLLWVNILAPWIFDPNQSAQVDEKKQKKMERKMVRRQNMGR